MESSSSSSISFQIFLLASDLLGFMFSFSVYLSFLLDWLAKKKPMVILGKFKFPDTEACVIQGEYPTEYFAVLLPQPTNFK